MPPTWRQGKSEEWGEYQESRAFISQSVGSESLMVFTNVLYQKKRIDCKKEEREGGKRFGKQKIYLNNLTWSRGQKGTLASKAEQP